MQRETLRKDFNPQLYGFVKMNLSQARVVVLFCFVFSHYIATCSLAEKRLLTLDPPEPVTAVSK